MTRGLPFSIVFHILVTAMELVYGNAVNPWRAEGSNAALTPGGSAGGSTSLPYNSGRRALR